jgi:hypothetical protein
MKKKNRGPREIRTTLRRANTAQLKETRRVFEALERQDKSLRQRGCADPFLETLKTQLTSLEHKRAATEAHVCCDVRTVYACVSAYLSTAQNMLKNMDDHSQMPVEQMVGKNGEGHMHAEAGTDKATIEGHTQTDKLQMSVGLSQTDATNEARAYSVAHATTSTSPAHASSCPNNNSASAYSDGDSNHSVSGTRKDVNGDSDLAELVASERMLREKSESEIGQLKALLEKERETRFLLEKQVWYYGGGVVLV